MDSGLSLELGKYIDRVFVDVIYYKFTLISFEKQFELAASETS